MVRAPLHFHGRIPVPEVAPLTYRDGVSQLELVYELSEYLKKILHPSLQSTVDQVVADAERLLSDANDQYVDGVQEFQRIHDAFMSDVNAALMALNDTAVSDLVDDATSMLGGKLRELFPDIAEFQGLGNLVVTGELTVDRIHQAAEQALSEDKTLVVSGELHTDETLIIHGKADLSNLQINYGGTGTALQIGDTPVRNHRHIYLLPRSIRHTRKVHGNANQWGAVQGTVGVHVVNIQSSPNITVPHVAGFETGLLVEGTDRSGCVYNTFFIGHLDNNRRNLVIRPSHGGWSAQHTFIGGRYSHVISEGLLVPGVEQILMENPAGTHMPDNNVFLNPSVEGSIAQYILSISGQANVVIGGRYEASDTSQPLTVRWMGNAQRNSIVYGRNAYLLEEHYEEGATRANNILAERQRLNMSGHEPVLQVSNSTSNRPVIGVYPPDARQSGDDPETAWATLLSQDRTEFKNGDDAHARIKIWHDAQRITFGDGSESQEAIGGLAAIGYGYGAISVYRSDFQVLHGNIGRDNFLNSPDNVYAKEGVAAQSYIKTGRHGGNSLPSASAYGQGAMIYNYTTRMPLWSDGTNWRNAMGEVI